MSVLLNEAERFEVWRDYQHKYAKEILNETDVEADYEVMLCEAQHKQDQEDWAKQKQEMWEDFKSLFHEVNATKVVSLNFTGIETKTKLMELKAKWGVG